MATLELERQTSDGTYRMVVPAGMSAVVMYCQSNPSSVYSCRQSNFCIPLLMAHSSRRSMFRGAYLLGEALLQSVVVVVVDMVGEEEKG